MSTEASERLNCEWLEIGPQQNFNVSTGNILILKFNTRKKV